MNKTIDEILSWASEAAREWKTIRMGIDPICHHEYASEIFDKHREEATQAIQALITEARIEQTNWFIDELWSDEVEPDKIYPKLKAEVDRLTQLKENK